MHTIKVYTSELQNICKTHIATKPLKDVYNQSLYISVK